MNYGRGYYTTPYDSTQGVPDAVFIFIWIILLLLVARILWDFRNKIFPKK